MAVEGTSMLDAIILSLKDVVRISLTDCFELTPSQIGTLPLKQKTKDLKSGDIIVPWFVRADENKSRKVLQNAQERLRVNQPLIKDVLQDKHNLLSFILDRPSVTRGVLKEVHDKGDKYGHCTAGQGCAIGIRPFINGCGCDDGNMTESPFHTRLFYILVHLKKLLEACGYQIHCNERLHREENIFESKDDGNKPSTPLSSSSPKDNSNIEEFLSSVKALSTKQKKSGDAGDGEIDLQSVIQQTHFHTGKDGLDKNLSKAEAFTLDGKASDVLKEAALFDASLASDESHSSILHVVPQGRVFRLHQMILLQASVSQKKINQSHLTVGPVVCKGDVSMEQFQRSRFEQMKEASEMRHGIKCEGPEWNHRIGQLSQSGIKIDVLGTAAHCPLKLDVQSNHGADNRLGAFVLYNTARLATLVRQFSLRVENGTYPPLPSLDVVNVSLLREQQRWELIRLYVAAFPIVEEWELLYLYVAAFPSVVRECVEIVLPGQGKLAAKIHTHRITNFLISFSKALSSYYSRYHILGGGESHLLPLMYARLWLVRACHRVMCNGLRLLDIQPLQEL